MKTDALEFGLPCHRRRVFAFFVRVVASPLFVFQDRPFDKVFATFRGLLAGCLIELAPILSMFSTPMTLMQRRMH